MEAGREGDRIEHRKKERSKRGWKQCNELLSEGGGRRGEGKKGGKG